MIILKPQLPRVDIRGQLLNSQKVSPSVNENNSEHLDISVHSQTSKSRNKEGSNIGSASQKYDSNHDDLDLPTVETTISINNLGRSSKSSGQRSVKVSNFTPRGDVQDALSGRSEHGTLATTTAGSRRHVFTAKNGNSTGTGTGTGGGTGGRAQSGKEPSSSSANDAWAEAHRKSKQPRRASEAHKMTTLGETLTLTLTLTLTPTNRSLSFNTLIHPLVSLIHPLV